MRTELTQRTTAYPKTTYHAATVDGLEIFYREAGSPQEPTVLLLHGFPTSSHMFRELIPALANDFHVIAPDYPGFGQSLITWGKNDPFFAEAGARAFLTDLPKAELHLLDTGHFALEEEGKQIAAYIVDFLDRKLK